MNYKLINIKNLLKIIISCLVVFSMCKSCAKAYTWDEFEEFITNYGQYQNLDSDTIVLCQWFLNNKTAIKSKIGDVTPYTNWYMSREFNNSERTYTNRLQAFNTTDFNYSMNSIYIANSGNRYNIYANQSNFSNIKGYSVSSQTNLTSQRGGCGLLTIEINGGTYPDNSYFQNRYNPIPPFDFTPYSIDEIDDYNIVKFAYTGNVALGALGDNTFYQLQVRLKDKNLNTIGTAYYDENGNNYYTDNALVIEGNIIKASTVYLYYTQPYILEFTIYSDSENYEINSYLYKFYPYSAVIENGVIVDSGDTTFNNQDQSIFIVNSIVGELPSGDKPGSGILGGIASLFIPRASFFLEYFNTFNTWLGDHLGILYAPFEIIFNLLNRIINVDFTDPMVEFGPFTLPLNDDIELINHYEYHFNDLLQDDSMAQIHDIYLIIVDGILILGLLYMVYCKYEEIIGGK